jgi:tetratricopeptide (TPR) repeat protein
VTETEGETMTTGNKKWFVVALLAAAIGCGVAQADADSGAADAFQRSYDSEARGKVDDALAALDALPSPEREGYVAELRRGWLLYKRGKHAQAVSAYAKAIAMEPRSIEARVGALLPLMALRRWADVEGGAREVLKADPGNYLANLRLAFAQYNLGRYAESAAAYRRLLVAYPSDTEVRSGLGWALLKSGKSADAAREFRALLEIAPKHALGREGLKASGG